VPADLALAAAAAERLLHLSERHGGGALVVLVRNLRPFLVEMVNLKGYELDGLNGLDGMSVRKKKEPARERRTRRILVRDALSTHSASKCAESH
jgi:hypothetical protein